jgi:NAD(P)-dependent dehydrogenase (short-subunit alcohol dehydrogenase family)
MELGLKDKVVLVTGASRGMGAAIAVVFGTEGSKLISRWRQLRHRVPQVG